MTRQETNNDLSNTIRYLILSVFLFTLASHFVFSIQACNEPIMGHHAQRQTQTAISSYWMLNGGAWVNYETPVFGPPWSAPMEFPSYQILVATLTKLTDWKLEVSGRTVSLFSFYLCLPFLYILGGFFGLNKSTALLPLIFALVSPVYLFWPRTIMIESTALLLTLVYLACACEYIRKGGRVIFLTALFFGVIAGATKVTTFAPAMGMLILLIAVQIPPYFRRMLNTSFVAPKNRLLITSMLLFIPILATKLWVNYSDYIKALNPNSTFITSESLKVWNFGTIEQRFSKQFLSTIKWELSELVTATIWVWLAAIVLLIILRPKKWIGIVVFFMCGSSGFIVFSNLYAVHDYYIFGTAFYFLFSLSLIIDRLLFKIRWKRNLALLFIVAMPLYSVGIYYNGGYFATLKQKDYSQFSIGRFVEKTTPESQPIAIIGQHYNSEIPFHSKRRSLNMGKSPIEEFEYAIENLSPESAFSILLVDKNHSNFKDTLENLLKFEKFSTLPIYEINNCIVYASKKQSARILDTINEIFMNRFTNSVLTEDSFFLSKEGAKGLQHLDAGITYPFNTAANLNAFLLELSVRPVDGFGLLSDGFRISVFQEGLEEPVATHRFTADVIKTGKALQVVGTFTDTFNGDYQICITDDNEYSPDYDWVNLNGIINMRLE